MSSHSRICLPATVVVLLGLLAGSVGAQDANSADANAATDVRLPQTPRGDVSIQEMIRRLNAAGAGAGLADSAQSIASPDDSAGKDQDASHDASQDSKKIVTDANSTPAEILEQMKKISPDTGSVGGASHDANTPRRRKEIDLQTLPADTVKNPILLADVLYLGGHWKAASTFYVMVTEDDKKGHSAPDQAWALYQLANCQRRFDPSQAKVTYKRLIEEHSTSPWAAASQVQQKLLTWKLSSKPEQLIEKHRKTGMDEVKDRREDARKGTR
ncbi:MAG: tetratricopeptide repeat protein [Planctomycetota bacterium]